MKMQSFRKRVPRRTLLSTALASALAVTCGSAAAGPIQPNDATTYEVTSCADDGSAGTLRYVIDHAVGDNDTADLSSLTCSAITLASGQIVISQSNFTLQSSHAIAIDAAMKSRVIEHTGTGGLLYLNGVSLTNGYLKYNSSTGSARGGCLLSNGGVSLNASSLSYCQVGNIQGEAEGGAIYAVGNVHGQQSTVSHSSASGVQALGGGIFSGASVYLHFGGANNNTVATSDSTDTNTLAAGGGIFAEGSVELFQSGASANQALGKMGTAVGGGVDAQGGLTLIASAISGNTATSTASSAGGAYAKGQSAITYSTFDHNQSVNNAALAIVGVNATIQNSTISTNTATTGSSAVFASVPLLIQNTTIAFNTSSGTSAGIYLYPGGTLQLESTIISNNKCSSGGASFDIVARAAITGSHNLIKVPQNNGAVPADTLIGVDPLLQPLAANGNGFGAAQTHALASTSPAIDHGSNPHGFSKDERGFTRVFGLSVDIGAYEWQGDVTDTIFKNGFEPVTN